MAVNADQIQAIIEIACQSLEISDNLRRVMRTIKSDVRSLKSEAADNDEVRLELADSILDQIESTDTIDIPERDRQALYSERARFQINFKKNQKRREAKRDNRLHTRLRNEETEWENSILSDPRESPITTSEIQKRLNWLEANPGQKYPEPELEDDDPYRLPQTGTDADTYEPPKLVSRKPKVEAGK